MAKGKSPAFSFYVNDWLSSPRINLMTPAEEGAYIRLLCYCWGDPDCGLPDDDEQLAILSRLNTCWNKSSQKLRNCFTAHPSVSGKITNMRLLHEREKQLSNSAVRALAGAKSGKARRSGTNKTRTKREQKFGTRHDFVGTKTNLSSSSSISSSSLSSIPISTSENTPNPPEGDLGPVDQVVAHYQTFHGRAKAGDRETKAITARLRDGFSVDDLKAAIDGCHMTPHNLGQNERGQKYLGLELIMRHASQVTRFMETAANPPMAVSQKTQRTMNAVREFASDDRH